MKELLFPPTLIKRALDDLSAIADAVRWLPRLHGEIVAMRENMEGLRAELRTLPDGITELRRHLDALRDEMAPISELHKVREGIDPLDEDMRSVRDSVDDLEPLLEQVNARLGSLDERIEALRADLSPLGELADKVPGIGR